MRCVECQHCTSAGVEPTMRRFGVNRCEQIPPDYPGQYFTVCSERTCHHFSPASQDVVAARLAWLDKRAWQAAPSTSTKSP